MNAERIAIFVLLFYSVVVLCAIIGQVWRAPCNWRVWILYAITRVYLRFVFHFQTNGPCPYPEFGPALIIANHRSPVDPQLVWMNHHLNGKQRNLRPISFFMAKEYFETPGLVGWVSRSMESIPVDRNTEDITAVRAALRRLKNGELVGVFPEGGINPEGESHLIEANTGIAWLALKTKVPVYPVFIHNAPQGESMIEPFYTAQTVKVSYGNPIDLSKYYGQKPTGELLQEVTDLLMTELANLGGIRYIGENRDDGGKSVLSIQNLV